MPLVAALVCAVVAGCAALPPDRGRGDVTALLAEHGIDNADLASPATDASQATEQDGAPLTLAHAVQLALVNNPELRARFAELGFAAADVYDAGRLSNPELSLGYMFVGQSALEDEKSVGLTQSFTDLIMLPARRRLAEGDFARVQHSVAAAVQRLTTDVAHAYYRLAGAIEVAAMHAAIADAARISAALAERYSDAGNLERRELAGARAAAATARLDALQAEHAVSEARAALARLLGARLDDRVWRLSMGLPAPGTDEADLEDLLPLADQRRLDLAAARRGVAIRADALGVTRQFRYLGELRFGPSWEWNDEGMRSVGPTLSAELPLFNQGAGKLARAEADLELAEAQLAALELEVVTELDRAAAAVANSRSRFEQYRAVLVPARREIVARRMEEVNFMLEGPFALLDAKQDEYHASRDMLQALQDYWLARVELARAAGQTPPATSDDQTSWLTAATLIRGIDAAPHPHEPDAATDQHTQPKTTEDPHAGHQLHQGDHR